MKKVLFLTTALIMSTMMWAGETKTLIIDGSQLTSTATSAVTDFTYGDFTIAMSDGAKFQASSGDNRFEGTDKAILIGKSGKYIYNKTPFGKITKFEIYANKGASAKVSVGVLFSTTAISSYSEGANTYTATLSTLDNVYDCSANIPDGAQYFWYQVTNANNSQVMFRITYEDGDTPQRTLESIYIAGEAENLEYFVGEEFDHAGLKVMGVYDDELGDAEITSGITWSYNPEVFALGNTSVDVTAQYKDFTSKVFTVNNIVVTEKPAPVGIAYTKVTDVAALADGDVIVLVSGEDAYGVAPDGKTFINAKAIDGVEATLVEGVLTAEDAYELTLSKSDDNWTMVGADGTVGTKAAKAFTFGDESVTNTWSISISEGNAIIASTNPDYGTIQYNASNPRFVNYTSTQKAIQIYKKANSPTAMPEVMENANVSKQLINGQLIIIRDNVRYNVAGQQL